MQKTKYYDYKNDRPLDLEMDSCGFNEWDRLYGKALFARHPDGFNIFLPPDKIVVRDENSMADPIYS